MLAPKSAISGAIKNEFYEEEGSTCSEGCTPSPYHVIIASPSVDIILCGHLVQCVHTKGEK